MRKFIAITSLVVALVATTQLPAFASAGAPSGYVVDGRGWGHGRGMGQYGARAQGEAGATWMQILSRYYTGIRLQHIRQPQTMRVLLEQAGSVVIRSDHKLTATWTSGRVLSRLVHAYFLISRVGVATVIKVSSLPTGPWRPYATGRARSMTIQGLHQVGVAHGSAVRWYRGVINVIPSGSRLNVIDTLSLDQYTAEVVPREMPSSWPINALRAQAVAARTYALRVAAVARANHRPYDICASDACQVFGGYARSTHGRYEVLESRRTNAAALSTAGWIMTWKGHPILAEYSSSTGGYTTSGGLPYLAPRPDPWDAAAPLHSWTEMVSTAEIQARWPSVGTVRSVRVLARDGRGDFGGRALSVVIAGTRGSVRVAATQFQYAFALPSDWFQFKAMPNQAHFRFTFNMGKGTHNLAVQYLQQRLRAAGFFPASTPFSTYFGPITEAALQRYQRAHRIPATGYLGPTTRARLNASA